MQHTVGLFPTKYFFVKQKESPVFKMAPKSWPELLGAIAIRSSFFSLVNDSAADLNAAP